ncbi:hypothetical protein Bca4012_063222 [Brassica carinata]
MKITACYLLSSVNMWIRIDHPHNIWFIPFIFDSLSISLVSKKKTLTKVKAENELMLSRFEQKGGSLSNRKCKRCGRPEHNKTSCRNPI